MKKVDKRDSGAVAYTRGREKYLISIKPHLLPTIILILLHHKWPVRNSAEDKLFVSKELFNLLPWTIDDLLTIISRKYYIDVHLCTSTWSTTGYSTAVGVFEKWLLLSCWVELNCKGRNLRNTKCWSMRIKRPQHE